MSRTYKDSSKYQDPRRGAARQRQRNISVRAVRRDPPDLRRLSRAVIELALAQAEAEAAQKDGGASTSEASDDAEPSDV